MPQITQPPNTDVRNYSIYLREFLRHPVDKECYDNLFVFTCTQCAAVTMTTGLQLSRAAPHPRHRLSDLHIVETSRNRAKPLLVSELRLKIQRGISLRHL